MGCGGHLNMFLYGTQLNIQYIEHSHEYAHALDIFAINLADLLMPCYRYDHYLVFAIIYIYIYSNIS